MKQMMAEECLAFVFCEFFFLAVEFTIWCKKIICKAAFDFNV